jgi:ubiquitin C-terminal hydrolase
MQQYLPLPNGSSYKLYGVVCHNGVTIHNGHYVSYVRTTTGWHLCDDQSVTPVSAKTVYNCQAYMLFYTQEVEVSTS